MSKISKPQVSKTQVGFQVVKRRFLVAVQESREALGDASPAIQNDRDVVLAAVKYCGLTLKYASPALRNDQDIVLAAMKEDMLFPHNCLLIEAIQVSSSLEAISLSAWERMLQTSS